MSKLPQSSKTMRLSLKADEKIYINGAILRPDRKVNLELLNDAAFLMENHVMQADETTTPLRQLYFVVQTMLIDPRNVGVARALFDRMHDNTTRMIEDIEMREGLKIVGSLVDTGRFFEALKTLRVLFADEARLLAAGEGGDAPLASISTAPAEQKPFTERRSGRARFNAA